MSDLHLDLEPIKRMARDIRAAGAALSETEARFLVDAYYQMQDNRIRADGQIRSMGDEPHTILAWLGDQNRILEQQVKGALDRYSAAQPIGQWMRAQKGVGPVIAAGLMAHIDINRAPTVGHIWSFAGLDPKAEWKKGTKRPWNAELKTLCWKLGECFVKVSGSDDAFYGKLYAERKAQEIAKNDAGQFEGQARAKLERFKIGKDTDAYKAYSAGKLPPAHIHARAKRYAVKMFLSHMHEIWRELEGLPCPKPFSIDIQGHAHYIPPPVGANQID